MSRTQATMVRVYLTESDHAVKKVVEKLHDEVGVCGVTVTRGVQGYGSDGAVHATGLLDLSGDLPLVLEFFDRPEKVEQAIAAIKTLVKPGHLVSWPVNVEIGAVSC